MADKAREIAHEYDMLSRGVDRFMAGIEGARTRTDKDGKQHKFFNESSTSYGVSMIKEYTEIFRDFLIATTAEKRGEACRNPIAFEYFDLLPMDTTAYIATKVIIDSITREVSAVSLATKIATHLEDQAKFLKFEKLNPKYHESIKRKFKEDGTTDYRHKKRVFTFGMGKSRDEDGNPEPVTWKAWPEKHKLHVGSACLEAFRVSTQLIDVYKVSRGKGYVWLVGPSSLADELIRENVDALASMTPDLMPMVSKPDPWTDTRSGGYYTREMKKVVPLIKDRSRVMQQRHMKRARAGKMDTVLKAATHLQNTAYVVDDFILGVIKDEWKRSDAIGLPGRKELKPAPCPIGDLRKEDFLTLAEYREARDLRKATMSQGDKDVFKEWSKEASAIYTREIKRKSQAFGIARTLGVAHQLLDEEALYFVTQADTRSRFYSVGTGLNPQGHGIAKALLKYKEGVKYGDTGFYHACLNAAGVYGVDKVSLKDRIDWVWENEALIKETGINPENTRSFWGDADKPYVFLQICKELSVAMYATERGEDCSQLATYLGCPQDGACNGLQHFNAILRNKRGGALVNLIDSEKPLDIYGKVAETTIELLKDMVDNNKGLVDYYDFVLAQQWLNFGLTRDETKKPVMVLPYGGTQRGTQQHFVDVILDRIEKHLERTGDDSFHPFGERSITHRKILLNPDKRKRGEHKRWSDEYKGGNREAAEFINKKVWQALDIEVVAARKAMKWLKSVAWQAAKRGPEGTAVEWVVPETGFLVVQGYYKGDTTFIRTQLCGECQLGLHKTSSKVDKHKQQNAVSPNLIHSLDAAHLMLVLCMCADEGINSFTAIHDSFATHAGHCERLHEIIRECFVTLHCNDVLNVWLNGLNFTEEELKSLPKMPGMGDLNLFEVLNSTFLFR